MLEVGWKAQCSAIIFYIKSPADRDLVHHWRMFIRRTQTRNRLSGEPYSTFRLVETSRVGNAVKQTTLLNLGSHFDLPKQEWPAVVQHIVELLRGQSPLFDATLSATPSPRAALRGAVDRVEALSCDGHGGSSRQGAPGRA